MLDWRGARYAAGVIGLVAALALAGCDGSSAKTPAAKTPAAPAATIAPTQTPSPPGVWATLTGCGPDVPGALRVRYQSPRGEDAVQRSDDCGATWRPLANPQIPGVSAPSTASITYWSVSGAPGYTDDAYVTAQVVGGDAQLCPATTCQVQYITTDGGQTWSRIKLPAPGYLADLQPETPPVSAIGTRLYGLVTDDLITVGPGGGTMSSPERLVVSVDHGGSWKLCDARIAAQGQQVALYAAPPTGSDLYVIAIPANTNSPNPPQTLWISHDAGETWTSIGTPPGVGTAETREGEAGGNVSAAFAGADMSVNGSTLYLAVVVQGHERVMASVDGGKTWQGDATLILDADANGHSPTFAGTLPDASLLIQYPMGDDPMGDGRTVAWKPGSALRTVAQNLGFQDYYNPLVVQESSGVYLWLSGDINGPDTQSVKYTRLKL